MPVRPPPFLKRLTAPGAEAFATLYALESLSRAILATVLPLQALKLVSDAQGVSLIFFAVSLISLCGGLLVPWLVRVTARRWVYSLGAVFLASAPFFLSADTLGAFFAGMALRALAIAAMAICFSLYIMDFIARKDFGRSEPMRLFYSAGAWSAGPFLGVYLAEAVHALAPYAVSALVARTTEAKRVVNRSLAFISGVLSCPNALGQATGVRRSVPRGAPWPSRSGSMARHSASTPS